MPHFLICIMSLFLIRVLWGLNKIPIEYLWGAQCIVSAPWLVVSWVTFTPLSNYSASTVHVVPAAPCPPLSLPSAAPISDSLYFDILLRQPTLIFLLISPFCQGLPKWTQVSSCTSMIKDLPLVPFVQTAQSLAGHSRVYALTFPPSYLWSEPHIIWVLSFLPCPP